MGSKFISKDIITKGDFENFTEEVKSTFAIFQRLQTNTK